MSHSSASELGQPLADLSAKPTIYANFSEAAAVKRAFLDHVKATNEPETFPGLCHTKPPSKKPRFVLIVDEFDIDPARRPDGEFIRCAACATKKKFRRGSLAWYPDEGVLRVVGNECGDERRVEAREDYKRRNTLDVLAAFLSEHLPLVHTYIAKTETYASTAKHAQELSLQLKTQARMFGETVLRAAKDGDGRLSIFASEVHAEGQQERRITYVVPQGLDFLRSKFQPGRRVDEALIRLKQADRGSPSKARRWLHGHRQKIDDLKAAYANLVDGLDKLKEAELQVRQVGQFLSQENLDGIDAWSGARGSPLRARWGSIFLTFHAPPGRGHGLEMTSLRPNWTLLTGAAL